MMADRTALSIEAANDLLRSHGLRRTFTRVSLLQCLAERSVPVTHAEISGRLLTLGFDSSTIFRGLNDLVDAGIVLRLDVGDRTWRFELRNLAEPSVTPPPRHPHLVCRGCGRIECLATNTSMPRLSGWQIDEAVFRGVCRDCSAQTPSNCKVPQ